MAYGAPQRDDSEVTKQADAYQLSRATRPIRELVEDLSNWYVRRSRRRFSKNDDADDKAGGVCHAALRARDNEPAARAVEPVCGRQAVA